MSLNSTVSKLLNLDSQPTNYTLGIDVSNWSGEVNWSVVKSKGVKFGITKVNDVGSVTLKPFYDKSANANYEGMKQNNILSGGFSWLDAFYDPIAQAKHYLAWYNSHITDLPPILDFEDIGNPNKQDYMNKARKWLEFVEKETNRTPIIYTAEWFMKLFNRSETLWMGVYPLWFAQYIQRSYPTISREWGDWTFWQYCDVGHYPFYSWANRFVGLGKKWGVTSSSLDMNYYGGSYEQLVKFCDTTGEAAPPALDEKFLYKAKVITKEGYNLLVRNTGGGTVVDKLPSGTIVEVYAELNTWARIGIDEWVSMPWIQRIFEPLSGLIEFPLYSQRNPIWGGDKMGSSNITLAQEGCLTTVMSGKMTILGHPETPKTFNQKLTVNGGYQSPNLFYWNMPEILYGDIKKTEYKAFPSGTEFEEDVDKILASGRTVTARVDWNPATLAQEPHWVEIVGKNNNVYFIMDSWDGTLQALNAKYNKVYHIAGYTKITN